MPQLIAAAAIAATGSTVAVAATATAAAVVATGVATVAFAGVTYATLIGYAVVMGASAAYSSSQSAKMRRSFEGGGVDQGRAVMVRDPISARRLIYGQVLVSGPIVFVHKTGTKNEFMHLVIVLAGHEVEEIGDIYFNDELVPLSSNVPVGKYSDVALINKKRGVAGDTADADLVAAAPTFWTSAHKLSGCAYLAVKLKWDADKFPNGLPTIKARVKGKKVYDPRSTLTAYSANAALCAADYLMDSTFGKGVALARVRSADLIEAANICEEDIVLDAVTTAGAFVTGTRYVILTVGTTNFTLIGAASNTVGIAFTATGAGTGTGTANASERRYETHGTINSAQDTGAVMRDLAGAMAGHIVDTGGTWTVRAGAHRTSTVTLTDADLIGAISVQPRQSRQDTFNRVRGLFISPINQWAAADFPAVSNATYRANDGGIWLDQDVQWNFTTSAATAQRLAKIELERGRQQITCSALYSLKALQCMPGDTVAITRDRFGWTEKLFEVVEWGFVPTGEGENAGLGIELKLRETAAGVWTWANGEETTVDLAPNTTLPNPFTVGAPAVTLLTDTTTVTLQPDGTVQPRLKVSWTTPNNIHVESGGFVEIEYKKTTDSDYTVWTEQRGDSLFDFITDVKVGVQYNVRVRFRNNAHVRGAYTGATSAAVVGDTVAPNAPASLTATAKPGYIDLSWPPSTSNTVNEYAIYRSITSALAGFTLLANAATSQYQDGAVSAGTAYWYYVKAMSASEIESVGTSVAGPITALIAPSGAVPGAATAPAQPASPVVGTYDASDGSVFSFVTLELAAMPAGAVWQLLLYRRTGASEYMVAGYFKNTGLVTTRLDDLSPGIGYDIATQAWNGAGGSSIVAGTSFTAPTKSTLPATPTGAILNRNAAAIRFDASSTFVAAHTGWADNTEKDLSHYEVKSTSTDSDAAVDFIWSGSTGTGGIYVTTESFFDYYRVTPINGYVRVRAVNTSGRESGWLRIGELTTVAQFSLGSLGVQAASGVTITGGSVSGITDILVADGGTGSSTPAGARTNLELGTLATQAASAVAITGGTAVLASERTASLIVAPAATTSPRANLTVYTGTEVATFAGGAASENINIDITNRGFPAKPAWGIIQIYDTNFLGVYDFDTGSTLTNARFVIFSRDGGNLPAGTRRVHFILGDY